MGQNQATSLLTSAHSADDIRDFRKGQVFTPFDHKNNSSNSKTHQPTTSIDDDFAERMNLQGLERNTDSNSGGSKRNSFKIPSSSSNNNRRRSQTTTAPTPTAATRSRMSCYYGSSPVQQQESILQQELQRKQQAQQEQEEQLQQKRTQRRKSFNIISRKNSNMF